MAKLLSRNEIRDRFVILRKRVWDSQSGAAAALGTDQGTVNQWESGKRAIPDQVLADVAEHAGETMAFFLPDALPSDERAEKLIAARWMEQMAQRLREEAGAIPLPIPAPVEAELAGETTEEVRRAEQEPDPQRGAASGRRRRRPSA